MNTQFHKGVIEMCILALVRQKDRYGYELVESISTEIPISEGTVYPILRRLTEDGSVESYLQESNEGPPRKYYRITREGKKRSEEQLKQWTDFTKSVSEILKQKGGTNGQRSLSL